MWSTLKALFSLLGLLDFFAGLIERARMKADIKAGLANEDFKELAESLRKDGDLEDAIRRDAVLRSRLRKRYSSDK